MEETNIRFEDLPEAVQWIKNKLTEIALKIDRMHGNAIEKEEPPQWFSIQELCDYLPEHPAIQTVYTWTSANRIPYYKEGKRIRFLKSEIDKWMLNSKLKSRDELEKEAQNFVESKRKNAFYGTKKEPCLQCCRLDSFIILDFSVSSDVFYFLWFLSFLLKTYH